MSGTAQAPGAVTIHAARSARGNRLHAAVAAWVARPGFWVLVVSVLLAVPLLGRILRPAPPPLAVLGTLPTFTFTDQDGRPYGSEDLRGKVWMAGFIFTRCPTICPRVSDTMAAIQKRARGLATDFHLVSISVDPGFDSPEVLAAYARRYRASPRVWKFLTGPVDGIRDVVQDGMKIATGNVEGEQDFASIMHGTHFVLVDRDLRIRAYHDSSDPGVVDHLLADAAMLVNRGN